MILDIALGLVFAASSVAAGIVLSRRLPELRAVPDAVVVRILQEDSSRLHTLFFHIFHFRLLYRQRHYQEKCLLIVAKVLLRLHILLLRFDNMLIRILQRARSRAGEMAGQARGDEYWSKLQDKEYSFFQETAPPVSVSARGKSVGAAAEGVRKNRIEDLRSRP